LFKLARLSLLVNLIALNLVGSPSMHYVLKPCSSPAWHLNRARAILIAVLTFQIVQTAMAQLRYPCMWNETVEEAPNVVVVGAPPSSDVVRRVVRFAFACVTSAPGMIAGSDVRGSGLMSLHLPLGTDDRLHFDAEIDRLRHGLPTSRWQMTAKHRCALDEARRLDTAIGALPGSHVVAQHSQLKTQLERFAKYLVNGFCSKRVYGGSFAGWVKQCTAEAAAPACSRLGRAA
jgi:hypothetical protein